MAFWQGLILFSLVASLFVVWPLIKFPFLKAIARNPIDYDQTQVDLYQEHLADLEKALAVGDIDQEQFEELNLDLQKTLVNEGEVGEGTTKHFGGKKILLGMAICVPIFSLLVYKQIGAKADWDIYQFLDELGAAETAEEHTQKLRDLNLMAQSRLNQSPDNLQLINLSAQTSMALQDYDQAVDMYRKILETAPESPQIMANLAQVLFYRAGYTITPEVREYTQKTLQLAPRMPEMLGLAGIDAKNQGDYEAAIQYWSLAVSGMDPNSNAAKGYLNGIEKARQALAISGNQSSSSDDTAKSDKAALKVTVALSDGVQVPPASRVFVYARAWQGAKVPLAIKGDLTVQDLPIEVTLDETMAMSPAFTITSADKLEVVARVSLNGSAAAQSGDWQASAGPIELSTQKDPVSLTISDQIP